MPTITFTLDCTPEQAVAVLAMLSGSQTVQPAEPTAVPTPTASIKPATEMQKVAMEFARFVRSAADSGYASQEKVMKKWIEADGTARWSDLIEASGVKDRQAYSGVAGSLSKNMRKARFADKWYRYEKASDGDWNLVIVAELVEPLKQAFAQLS
jgi:hypothetical protein